VPVDSGALRVTDSPGGAVIAVRAMPRASRPGIAGVRDGALVVRLQSAPADGAANAELVAVLAGALGIPRRDVAILSGSSSRSKRLRAAGLTAAEVVARLSALDP
jgi:uncharacterized protein (TIGR00251 family)